VWNGKNGALIAKAMKKPRNSQRATPVSRPPAPLSSVAKSKVFPPTTHSPITEASMNRPPTRLYRKNFTAAYCLRAPPNEPMMKYIGISMISKNT
jgi:hypothetical protein